VVGWGDFPVALSQEDHPSLVQWTQLSSCTTSTTTTASNNTAIAATTGIPTTSAPTLSSSSRVVTFGWHDFPIVGESTSSTMSSLHLESSSLQLFPLRSSAASTSGATLISVKQSRVRFGTLQVREYDIELGDHPLCPHFPWTLGWTYSRETKETITVKDDYSEATFQPTTRTKRTGPLEPLQRRRRNHYQPVLVGDRRCRLADFLAISLNELDAMEDERRKQSQQVELHCVEIDHDEVEAPLPSTSRTSSTTAGLHRTSSNFVLCMNDNDGHPPTTAKTPSCSRDWWSGGCVGGGLLEMEMDDGTNHNSNSATSNTRYATAWQLAHLLDMNLHIGGHAVHPGFEIEIYQ
jgi:hypothetical protein